MKRVIIIIIMVLFVDGCAGEINKAMQSWVGHHSDELITEWGPPSRILDDGDKGKLFIYESGRSYTSPGYASMQSYGSFTYYPPQTSGYTASRTFWINNEGIIYRWAWKGL